LFGGEARLSGSGASCSGAEASCRGMRFKIHSTGSKVKLNSVLDVAIGYLEVLLSSFRTRCRDGDELRHQIVVHLDFDQPLRLWSCEAAKLRCGAEMWSGDVKH
jgi:hypothetical protein